MGPFRRIRSSFRSHTTKLLQSRSVTPTANAIGGPDNGEDGASTTNEANDSVPIPSPAHSLREGSTTPAEGEVSGTNGSEDTKSTKRKTNVTIKAVANPGDEESDDDDEGVWKDIAHIALSITETAVDVSGVFPPFQIVAVGLKLILEHAESSSENKKAARELTTRVDQLKVVLKGLPPDDPDAIDGSQRLLKKLQKITDKLGPVRGLAEPNALRDKCIRFIMASKNAGILQDCLKIIDDALTDYQLWMMQRIFAIVSQRSKSEESRLTSEQDKAAQGVKDAAHDLEIRIEGIMQVLESSPNDPDVASQCQNLSKELNRITDILSSMGDLSALQDRCARLATLPENAQTLRDCITIVDNALMQYQLSMTQRICGIVLQQLKSEERSALYRIKRADQASFFAEDRPKCLEGTRKEVLDALQDWALSESGPQFFWLNGPAGSGKSTIAQTFAHWLHLKDKLGASFFCSRNSEARRDLKMIFPTISLQLATSTNIASPKFRDALLRALEANPDGASLSLQNQLSNLMVHPARVSAIKTVVVIDALDECSDDSTTSTLLSLLDHHLVGVNPLKFFITSRPENNIQLGFKYTKLSLRSDKQSLSDVPTIVIDEDIRCFLDTRLRQLSTNRPYLHLPANWPSREVLDVLTRKSAGLFIYASTVLKIVDDPNSDPRDHLDDLVANPDDYRLEGLDTLDQLYATILETAFRKHNSKQVEQRLLAVLGLLLVARDSLSCTAVAELLGLKRATDVLVALNSLHSLISVQENLDAPILFHHKSIPDFLTDTTRCTDSRFYVDRDAHNFSTSSACLRLLEQLKKNICSVPRYTYNADIDPEQIRTNISETMRYCCRYWADHLLAGDEYARARFSGIQPPLLRFLRTRQLQWFEVLGLLQELRYAVESLDRLRTWLSSMNRVNRQYQEILDWVIDGRKFVLYAFDVIHISVAHIYHSALPFAPRVSLLRKQHYEESGEARIVRGAEEAWPESDRTFQVPGEIFTLEYASDGSMISVGGGHFQHIYRASTGEKIFELNHPSGKLANEVPDVFLRSLDIDPTGRHLPQVRSITFSRDSKTIATVSGPEIILWDCSTGGIVGTLPASDSRNDHPFRNQIAKLEFHPTFHHLLLSCDRHGRIFLWDTHTTTVRTICVIGDGGDICWLKRSQEKKVVIRLRCQSPIELWDVEAEPACVVKVFEHLPSKSASSDGDICASKSAGSGGGASASSSCNCDLGRYAMSTVTSSGGGTLVASTLQLGSSSFAVYDAATGDCVKSIHPDRCSATQGLQFLPGGQVILLSSSIDPKSSLLRVWPHSDYSTGDTVLASTHSFIDCLAISPGGDTIVFSRSGANFVEVYDITTPKNTQQHASYLVDTGPSLTTKFHHFSINGKLFCTSTGSERIVQVWYTDDGTPCGIFGVPSDPQDAIILKDNIHAITLHTQLTFRDFPSAASTLILWNIRTGTELGKVYFGKASFEPYILPYTHDNAIGCFYIYLLYDLTCHFECYTFSPERKTLVKAAQGTLSQGWPLRVHHEACSESPKGDITLRVECVLGQHFSAVWKDAMSVGTQPQLLDFVPEGEQGILKAEVSYSLWQEDAFVGSERRCRYSPLQQHKFDKSYKNEGWVDNDQGVPILWIPPSYRIDNGMEHKEAGKFVWVKEGRELLLVDISHVHTDPTDKPFGMF